MKKIKGVYSINSKQIKKEKSAFLDSMKPILASQKANREAIKIRESRLKNMKSNISRNAVILKVMKKTSKGSAIASTRPTRRAPTMPRPTRKPPSIPVPLRRSERLKNKRVK